MNEDQYNETVERLRAANEIIKELDPAIRAEAFSILRPHITGEAAVSNGSGNGDDEPEDERPDRVQDEDALIERHISDRCAR